MKPEDRVGYAADFLKQIGQITGDIPHRRGTFKGYKKVGSRSFAQVKWDDADTFQLVLPKNIAKVGPNIKFCAC